MGYYAQNPYELPEPPRCIECDDCMTERRYGWICANPDCPNCDDWRAVAMLVEEIPPEPTLQERTNALYMEPMQAEIGSAEWWDGIQERPF
jgi:hypothetical protein